MVENAGNYTHVYSDNLKWTQTKTDFSLVDTTNIAKPVHPRPKISTNHSHNYNLRSRK